MFTWTSSFGAVGLEVFGQYGPGTFRHPAQLFDHHRDRILEEVGLSS